MQIKLDVGGKQFGRYVKVVRRGVRTRPLVFIGYSNRLDITAGVL
jgi:hypothetical protein